MDGAVVSARERQVLELLGEHLTHEEIGRRLYISVRTVESHSASLRRKLGISDHRSLVRYAVEHSSRVGLPAPTLPLPLSSFVGREAELAELRKGLRESRLVSVVGPGGVGKTRLVLEVARPMASDREVHWVGLVPVVSRAGLEDALVASTGAVQTGRIPALVAVATALRDRRTMVVFDNSEHLVEAVSLAAERLLAECPDLTVLVTSRARLALAYERVVRLDGMSVAPTGDAVRLFLERAEAAGAHLPRHSDVVSRVAAVCEAVGGLALGVELAAARVPSLGLDGVERALDDQSSLLTGTGRKDARHRSMDRTLDWSVALIDPQAAAVMRRTAVLVGPFDATAAAAVAGFEPLSPEDVPFALAHLVDHSLLTARTDGARAQYRMLEPIRQYAVSRMTPVDAAAFTRHLHWCRDGAAALLSEDPQDGPLWIADDARAALAHAAATQTPLGPVARELARSFGLLLFRHANLREAQERLEQAAYGVVDRDAARDLTTAAAVANCRLAGEETLRLQIAAGELYLEAGDGPGAAVAFARGAEQITRFRGSFANEPAESAAALVERARASAGDDARATAAVAVAAWGWNGDTAGDVDWSTAAVEMARGCGDLALLSAIMDARTDVKVRQGDLAGAYRVARERLAALPDRTWDPTLAYEIPDALHMAVMCAVGAGDLVAARAYAERIGRLPHLQHRPDLAVETLLLPTALAGDWDAVDAAAQRFLRGWTLAGKPCAPGRGIYPAAAALAYAVRGDPLRHQQWREISDQMHRGLGRSHGTGLFDAIVLLDAGRPEEALALLDRHVDLHSFGLMFVHWIAAVTAEAAVLSGADDAPQRIAGAHCAENPIAEAITRRAAALLASDGDALPQLATDFIRLGATYQAQRTRDLGRTLAAEVRSVDRGRAITRHTPTARLVDR